MSDALPLPPRPSLEQYRKLARDLQHACKSSQAGAVREWAARWVETLSHLQGVRITDDTREALERQAEGIDRRWHANKGAADRGARCLLRRRAVLRRARARLCRLAGIRRARRVRDAAPFSREGLRGGGGRDRQRRRDGAPQAAARASGAGARPVDARPSVHAAPLRLGERHRGLPPADSREHRRDRDRAAEGGGRRQRRVRGVWRGIDHARVGRDEHPSGEGRRADRAARDAAGVRRRDRAAGHRRQPALRHQGMPRERAGAGSQVFRGSRRGDDPGGGGGSRAPRHRDPLFRRAGRAPP